MRNTLAIISIIVGLSSCGVPTSDPAAIYTAVPATPIDTVVLDTTPTIVMGGIAETDTCKISITGTSLDVISNIFSTHTEDNVRRIVLEFKEGQITFCKLNNIILYGNGDKVISHEYVYLSQNVIRIQEGNTLSGIAVDHNTTVENLRKLNNLKSNVVQKGAALKIH